MDSNQDKLLEEMLRGYLSIRAIEIENDEKRKNSDYISATAYGPQHIRRKLIRGLANHLNAPSISRQGYTYNEILGVGYTPSQSYSLWNKDDGLISSVRLGRINFALTHKALEEAIGDYDYEDWNKQRVKIPQGIKGVQEEWGDECRDPSIWEVILKGFFDAHPGEYTIRTRGTTQKRRLKKVLHMAAEIAEGSGADVVEVGEFLLGPISTGLSVNFYKRG